ncbi:MAG: aminoacyl-tRNA hydrolase [Endomicrobium sp.]|jgi:PTH1 family peptidyl-tRNA hydrolase|nr:aminoacyl-tRNA hydrolase [Endomicrobium sp.]
MIEKKIYEKIKLFVGLGNFKDCFKKTRHNFGFIAIDEIAKVKNINFTNWKNIAYVTSYTSNGIKKWLLKPKTFMNNSGYAVKFFIDYYKIKPEEIIVLYDDVSIPFGKYKLKTKIKHKTNSFGRHNGIMSLIKNIHSHSFLRMKLGIGPLPKDFELANFVLSKFSENENRQLILIRKIIIDIFNKINTI